LADPITPALLAAVLAAADVTASAGSAPAGAAAVDYTRDVAPILAARCYQCHGPDGSSRKAGFRLDRREAAIAAPSDPVSRAAIAPGKPDDSELIARITSADPDLRMPPTDGHAALTPAEVATLRAWIAAGAPYAKHWSWQPLPALDASAVGLDELLATQLAQAGASVAPSAWLRRVHFDIVGLPPSPEECRAFERSMAAARTPAESDAARTAVVDALLASPRYGERWARHWMDVMRFAETHGHEFDYAIDQAWRWRDWAIRAFNADLPYADFVREQIAGDLLPSPRLNASDGTDEGLTATGWWWMTQGTHAPVDVRLDQAERIDNQIDVASKAFLGTTASCARCHDHKFDDVTQRDYYALFGVVKSSRRAYGYQDPHGAIRAAADRLAVLRDVALAFDARSPEWDRTEARARATPPPSGATWTFDGGTFDGWTPSGWAFGKAPVACGDRLAPDGAAPVVAAGSWAHSGALSGRLRGTLRSPTFTVPEVGIGVRCAGKGCRVRLVIDGYFLDDRNELLFEGFIQGVDHPSEWRTHAWDAKRYAGEPAHLEVIDDGDGFIAVDWVSLGMVTGADLRPAPFECAPGAPSEAAMTIDVPAPVRVLAMEDGTGMDSPLYVRGSSANLGQMVPRGMIAGLRARGPGGAVATDSPGAAPQASDSGGADAITTPAAGSGRLQLAEEIVAPGNPLTWRVMANRVWHHLMGRGIVASTDDFGVLGQAPADRELLDALAMRLRDHGSVKRLVREIVLSPRYAAADRPVRRMEAESLRDAIIAVCGGLDLSMGGPSVPIHLTDSMQGRGRPAQEGPLDGARRRSVYVEVRRNFLSPFLQVFDQPVPTTTVGARSTSNVPAQGLALMNDPFVRGQAERWGKALAEGARSGSTRGVVADAYLAAYGRHAADAEVSRALAFLGDAPDAGSWSDFAHAVLLSTEFRYLP
jgi:cytochrome c553